MGAFIKFDRRDVECWRVATNIYRRELSPKYLLLDYDHASHRELDSKMVKD